MTTVVLDNEAVQALATPHHPKGPMVFAHLVGQQQRRRRGVGIQTAWVPTTVRAEAGWDRTDPSSAGINRLRIDDRSLDTDTANATARLVALYGVSPADAHIGATVAALGTDVSVLTSDPDDIARVCPPGIAQIIRI